MDGAAITRRGILLATAAGLVSIASGAEAAPAVGQPFPRFTAFNLEGNATSEQELRGRLTLVAIVTSPAASDRLNAWMLQTKAAFPDDVVRRVVFLALNLAFFVPSGVVKSKARGKVPRQYWKDTILDVHGDLARQLGMVTGSDKPFVVVHGKDSLVRVAVHGALDATTKPVVWAALNAGP